MRRVAITGAGCVCALGLSAPEFWDALKQGRSGIGPIQSVPREKLANGIGAEVQGFDPARHFDPKRLSFLDRFSQFAVVAAREAVRDAGLQFSDLSERTAVIVGTGSGGSTTDDQAHYELYGQGNPRVHPLVIPRLMASAATSHVTMEFGLHGPAFGVTSACSSAAHAIGQAMLMIRAGLADVAITGGSEACFTLGALKAWEAMRVMAPDTCRPFSAGRNGMVLGEGAGIVVLEALESAQQRGGKLYAELAGLGMSADAAHLIQPSCAGASRAMRAALADAGLQPGQIAYINAHGTGTEANDATECAAIREVFGAHAPRLAVSSTKSMHGHALGASGALELIATAFALREGWIPPTLNYLGPDPRCGLDCVPNQGRPQNITAALSNAFAFGGLNAVLALRRLPPGGTSAGTESPPVSS